MGPASKTHLAFALALASHVACADSGSVAVYGSADMYMASVKNVGGTAAQGTVSAVNSGGLTTSFIGFRGQEDLGGGNAAIFSLESFIRMDTGVIGRNDADPLWGRAANVGLSTRFGRVTLGRHVTPYSLAATLFTPLKGTTSISPIFSTIFRGNVQGDTRFNNSVRYVSPNMDGWNADVVASLGRENPPGPDERRERAVDGSLRYDRGPLSLIAATRQINLNTAFDGHKQKAYMGGAMYDLQFVKLNAQYHWSKESFTLSAKDITRKVYELGAAVPMGAGAFDLSWSVSNNERPLASGVSDKRTAYVLAYDYNLSVRTDVYVGLFRDAQKHPDILQRQVIGGVRHNF
jgi:predicted porin